MVQPVVLKQESVRVAAVVQIGGRPIRPSEPEPSLPDFPAAAAASGAAREAEIEALRREVEDLQQALRDATANDEVAAQAAYEKGAAEGRRLAHVAAEADRSKLESALAAAAEKAAGAFEAKFDKLEQLALEAALIAVERVLGANSDRAAIVEQIVLEQLRSLRGTTVLSLTVSAADFSDAVPLAAAIDQRKFSRCEVKLSPQLETGGCQFELSAGSLDAGVSTQIEALREVLRGESR